MESLPASPNFIQELIDAWALLRNLQESLLEIEVIKLQASEEERLNLQAAIELLEAEIAGVEANILDLKEYLILGFSSSSPMSQ